MRRDLVVSFWCLIIVACASQQVTITSTPVSHFTAIPTSATVMPTITFVPAEYPNKFTKIGDGRIKFDNWHLSFSLPKEWDANQYDLYFQANPYAEQYAFYGPEYPIYNGGRSIPILSFDFRHIPDNVNTNELLQTIEKWTDDPQFEIEKYYSLKELGLNSNTVMGYKCAYTYGLKYKCFVLRAVYEKEIIEMHVVAIASELHSFEMLFLETTKSISFKQ